MELRAAGLATLFCALAAVHCGGSTVPLGGGTTGATDEGANDGGVPGDTPSFDDPRMPTMTSASKVDVLLAVDGSPGMKVKAEYFAQSLGSFLQHVAAVTPDIHLGVITSSLDGGGGDFCDAATTTLAHLQRVDATGAPVTASGVLAMNGATELPSFVRDAERLVRGVGERGCGLEAQLESVYRFLVQPDPYNQVQLDVFKMADLGQDLDVELLRERASFLRPDSLVVILMVTDEDDSAPDPRAVGGFGWAFANRDFPGSAVHRGAASEGTTAARATATCATNPASEDCTSCGFALTCDPQTATCQKIRNDPSCHASGTPGASGAGFDGYYGPSEDDVAVRFHRMKERFGVDPQYPVDRYVAGFGASSVGDRQTEHPATTGPSGMRQIETYHYRKACTNPLFATQLPTEPGDEFCRLPRNARTPDFVVFGLLAGVPPELVEQPSVDWTKVLGQDPERFDYSGIDPHMIASTAPRPTLLSGGDPSAPRGDRGSDPVSGREWLTRGKDLQYACTFELPAPQPCAAGDASCDCGDEPSRPGIPASNPPLCASDGTATQTWGKAYPSTRELLLAKKLGSRSMVGSVCARRGQPTYGDFMDRFEGVVLPRLK